MIDKNVSFWFIFIYYNQIRVSGIFQYLKLFLVLSISIYENSNCIKNINNDLKCIDI